MEHIIQQYIELPVALGVFILMEIIKRTKPDLDKRFIPIMSAVLGIVFVIWANGLDFSFSNFLLGVASGGSSTWLFEVIKNFRHDSIDKEPTQIDSMGELDDENLA